MQYINEKEFLKQDEKIRKNIIDWWQPEVGDLFNYKHRFYCVNYAQGTVISPLNNASINTVFNKIECIPLLTEGQLREFINSKGFYIDIKTLEPNGAYQVYQYVSTSDVYGLDLIEVEESVVDTNLLQALWRIACNVANY